MGRHLDIVWIDGYLYFGWGGDGFQLALKGKMVYSDGLSAPRSYHQGCDSPDGNWLQRERDSLVCLEQSWSWEHWLSAPSVAILIALLAVGKSLTFSDLQLPHVQSEGDGTFLGASRKHHDD